MFPFPGQAIAQAKEQNAQMLLAIAQATNVFLGLDKTYDEHRQTLLQIVHDCGGNLQADDLDKIEKNEGVTDADKKRWNENKWKAEDGPKLLRIRQAIGKLLKEKLTDVQQKCVKDKVSIESRS